jgi:hypothetical protein
MVIEHDPKTSYFSPFPPQSDPLHSVAKIGRCGLLLVLLKAAGCLSQALPPELLALRYFPT